MSRHRLTADGKLPRPDLPKTTDHFWHLAWYFRKLTECDALASCRKAEYRRKRENRALTYALTSAIMHLEDEIRDAGQKVQEKGLLPFAWAGTTVFATEAVPA